MSLQGQPSLIKVDEGYIVRANFSWLTGVSGPALSFPSLFETGVANNFSNGLVDVFDAKAYQGNIAIPPIKSVRGIVNFNNQPSSYVEASELGPLVISAPDTQDVIVIRPDRNIADSTANVGGVPTDYTRMFQLPLYTNGTVINILKIADLNPLQVNGLLMLFLMTFEAPIIY